ncbi:MAG: hypothetical protein Salg2KO_07900 [Salibacteraceae bacterium]
MKHILSSLVLVVSVLVSTAQVDISATDIRISCDNLNRTPIGINTGVEIELTNNGPGILEPGSTIHASISYNNSLIQHEFSLTAPLNSGEKQVLQFGPMNRINIREDWDTITFQAHVQWESDSIDSNDFFVEDFYSSTMINNDWNSAKISILAPSNLNNFDVDNGTNFPPPLSSISIDLVNNGPVTYLEHSLIEYSVYIGNDERSLEGSISDGEIGPNSTTTRTISNQAVLPSVPDSAGIYQLCARISVPQDKTDNNDASCKVFAIVDNYDPNDPNNWAWSVDEISDSDIRVFANNGLLTVNAPLPYTAHLIDLSGRLVESNQGEGLLQISVDGYSSGLYFVRLMAENGEEIDTRKVVFQ